MLSVRGAIDVAVLDVPAIGEFPPLEPDPVTCNKRLTGLRGLH